MLLVLFTLLLTLAPLALDAQSPRQRGDGDRTASSEARSHPRADVATEDLGPFFRARLSERRVPRGSSGVMPYAGPPKRYPDRYIVVNLSENHVYLFEGDRTIWSARAGTGTGGELSAGSERSWDFSTPTGIMEVKRMEKDPIWVASDWYFIEKGLSIPPPNDPKRMIPGVMGTTAIYLGDGIAIHGTNSPELIADPDPVKRRISHGCIRLTNENARRLMNMVEVGTPVLIY